MFRDLGISGLIAESINGLFFRNCINIGMPIIEQPQAAKEIQAGDQLEVDLDQGVIKNLERACLTKNRVHGSLRP